MAKKEVVTATMDWGRRRPIGSYYPRYT